MKAGRGLLYLAECEHNYVAGLPNYHYKIINYKKKEANII